MAHEPALATRYPRPAGPARAVPRTVEPAPVSARQDPALRGRWRSSEPMARHVSWRAGGPAQHCYEPADVSDLALCLSLIPADEAVHFVGLGSNLLVRDGGLRGTVVLTHGCLGHIALAGDQSGHGTIEAQCGVASPKLARLAARAGLAGAEFFAGIPGTVGGALAMNAGCYGAETWDRVLDVITIDRTGRLRTRVPADYDVGYRHVGLRAAPVGAEREEWFLSGRFRFPRGDSKTALSRIKELLARRIAAQPLGEPNAGSVFRNPPGDHAARLIEASGLKGIGIGGAQVSTKHANFIVNRGAASASDIERLIELVEATVERKTGVRLVREVRIVGEQAATGDQYERE
jgi:UDP-N-acetylmuramate dehydrogenase